MHRHKAMELNFIQNGKGVRRVVGGSSEEIGDYEIALIGEDIEHAWEQGECSSEDVREITIHFPANLFDGNLIEKKQFASIKEMIKDSRHGITFGMSAILKVYTLLDSISSEKSSFEQFLIFERILHTLSKSDYRLLTSKSSTEPEHGANPDKIGFIKEYLKLNYSKNIRLSQLSELTGLSTTSIARLFKQRSGMTLSSYLIDLKCQSAARSLVDTSDRIADIRQGMRIQQPVELQQDIQVKDGKDSSRVPEPVQKEPHQRVGSSSCGQRFLYCGDEGIGAFSVHGSRIDTQVIPSGQLPTFPFQSQHS